MHQICNVNKTYIRGWYYFSHCYQVSFFCSESIITIAIFKFDTFTLILLFSITVSDKHMKKQNK